MQQTSVLRLNMCVCDLHASGKNGFIYNFSFQIFYFFLNRFQVLFTQMSYLKMAVVKKGLPFIVFRSIKSSEFQKQN